MKKLLIAFFCFVWIFTLHAQEKFVARIQSPKVSDLSEFLKKGYDIASFYPEKYIDLVLNREEFLKLQDQGYTLTITQTERQLRENMVGEIPCRLPYLCRCLQ